MIGLIMLVIVAFLGGGNRMLTIPKHLRGLDYVDRGWSTTSDFDTQTLWLDISQQDVLRKMNGMYVWFGSRGVYSATLRADAATPDKCFVGVREGHIGPKGEAVDRNGSTLWISYRRSMSQWERLKMWLIDSDF